MAQIVPETARLFWKFPSEIEQAQTADSIYDELGAVEDVEGHYAEEISRSLPLAAEAFNDFPCRIELVDLPFPVAASE